MQDLKQILVAEMHSFASLLIKSIPEDDQDNNLDLGPTCRSELAQIASEALKNQRWALKVFDSNGRLRSGSTRGSLLNLLGDFDQCLSISREARLSRGLKFCLVQIDISGQSNRLMSLLDWFNGTLRSGPLLIEDKKGLVKFGSCVPGSCSSNNVASLSNHLLASHLSPTLRVNRILCNSQQGETPSWTDQPLVLVLLGLVAIIVGLVTIATLLDLNKRRVSRKSRLKETLKCFSAIGNFSRLTRRRSGFVVSEDRIDTSYLDGLRVLSMIWVIAAHSYSFSLEWLFFDNPSQVDRVYRGGASQWLANGTFAIDNFLVLSGLLSYFKYTKQESPVDMLFTRNNNKWKRLLYISIHRYLRLMPAMMIVILINVALLPNLSSGPNWHPSTTMFAQWCDYNWPSNLLMIQNIVNTSNMCLSHSWFVAVDFQLFVIVQFLLTASLSRWTSSRRLILAVLLLVSIVAQLFVALSTYLRHLPSVPLLPGWQLDAMVDYYSFLYIKPIYWMASYCVGVFVAMQIVGLSKRDASSIGSIRLSTVINICLIIQTILVLSHLPLHLSNQRLPALASSLYSFLARPIWSLCLGALIFFSIKTAHHRLPLLQRLVAFALTRNIWKPLSKLTYCAYLIHLVIIGAFYGSRSESFDFSHTLLLYFTVGHICFTYCVALLVHLLFEAPIRSLLELAKLHKLLSTWAPECREFTSIKLRPRQQHEKG